MEAHFLDPGCALLILLSTLLTAPWAGSKAFTVEEQLASAFACYYWSLSLISTAAAQHGQRWSEFFLPIATCRNILCLCSHAMLAIAFWDETIPFSPSHREERFMEQHFSRCKDGFRGTPSLKCGILGTTRCHLQQSKVQWGNTGVNFYKKTLPMDDVRAIAQQSLEDVLELQAMITVNGSTEEIRRCLDTWWHTLGPALVGEAPTDPHGHLFVKGRHTWFY